MTVKKPDPPVHHPQERWGVPFQGASPVAPRADAPEVSVALHTTRPAPGTYQVLVAVIDDQGRVRQATFALSDVERARLDQSGSWERHFLPALSTLAMESSLQPDTRSTV